MKIIFNKEINIKGFRYPKVFNYNNKIYLIGSVLYQRGIFQNNKVENIEYFENEQNFNILHKFEENQINKYKPILCEINNQFEITNTSKIILNKNLDNDIFMSSWIRDVHYDQKLFFNVEHKKNIENKTFEDHNFQYSTNDLCNFNIEKIYKDVNSFLFKDFNNIIIHCDISKDKDDEEHFWGKYLFFINNNGEKYRPNFDNIVDYSKDKGHLMHNLLKINDEEYLMLFSIRHQIIGREFRYDCYTAKTKNFVDFYQTQKIEIDQNYNNNTFISYPHLFKINEKWFLVCNQDDFGKYKNLLLFDVIL